MPTGTETTNVHLDDSIQPVPQQLLQQLCERFRGYYPVVIDVETAGFDARQHALLEIAAVTLKMNQQGWLEKDQTLHFHVIPFTGSVLDPAALIFNGIDPENPLRLAVSEYEALHTIFKVVRKNLKIHQCNRAVIVAHNANFDHSFVMAAVERTGLKRNPFHPFVTFDTASLAALTLGQTVLSRACSAAGINFDNAQAHSALYDTEQTALLFCEMINRWKRLGGWPPPATS